MILKNRHSRESDLFCSCDLQSRDSGISVTIAFWGIATQGPAGCSISFQACQYYIWFRGTPGNKGLYTISLNVCF